MQASELRIGNIIISNDVQYIVKSISGAIWGLNCEPLNGGEFMCVTAEHAKGIRLTEKHLLTNGFKQVPHRLGTVAAFKFRSIRIGMSNSGNFYYGQQIIPHLHTLQNLVFSINGKELIPQH